MMLDFIDVATTFAISGRRFSIPRVHPKETRRVSQQTCASVLRSSVIMLQHVSSFFVVIVASSALPMRIS